MSFVEGNLGTWPKEKRFVFFLVLLMPYFKIHIPHETELLHRY